MNDKIYIITMNGTICGVRKKLEQAKESVKLTYSKSKRKLEFSEFLSNRAMAIFMDNSQVGNIVEESIMDCVDHF